MIKMMIIEKYFVYEWYNIKNRKYYVGLHNKKMVITYIGIIENREFVMTFQLSKWKYDY